jgi:methionyl-tRNA formyltransferase
LRIIYLGTPDFAVNPLKKLLENGYNVVAVVCNHDKPVGRKQVLTPPPVKTLALENNIPCYQYDKIRVEGVEDLKALKPDLMVTCAFGQILSQEILDIPRLGVINIHASLLPKYRGASPIHYAILNGESKTGITIMKTDIGIDTGDIIMQEEIDIPEKQTMGELFESLSVLGADLIVKALPSIIDGTCTFTKQDEKKATLTKIIKKDMAKIDWNNSAKDIVNQIRAFNPSPVAFTTFENNPFKIYEAEVSSLKGQVGKILKADKELVIGCKDSSVSLKVVQKAGGKPMNIADFLRGAKLNENGDFC